jgi:broad specificity phosphatase PhoE
VRLFVLARHGRSLLNQRGVVNGDPRRDPGLSQEGVEHARELGRQLSGLAIGVAAVSPFPRAMQTADAALAGRAVPRLVDDELGDIRIGELDGATLADYHRARAHNDRNVPFPGGESLNEAALRYAQAFERLLLRADPVTLVVTHEYPVRYAVNAAGGGEFDSPLHAIPNATPYLVDEPGLGRAVARIRELAAQ